MKLKYTTVSYCKLQSSTQWLLRLWWAMRCYLHMVILRGILFSWCNAYSVLQSTTVKVIRRWTLAVSRTGAAWSLFWWWQIFYTTWLHCPRAGPGRATLSLALAPGRLDPGPGPGQGRVRAGSGPTLALWYLVVNWILFFKCSNFSIFVDFYVLLNSSVNSYLFMMK